MTYQRPQGSLQYFVRSVLSLALGFPQPPQITAGIMMVATVIMTAPVPGAPAVCQLCSGT